MVDPVPPQELLSYLSELNIVSKDTLDTLFNESKKTGKSFTEELLNHDVISDENLGKVCAELLKVPFINLSKQTIPLDVLATIPEIVAKKQNGIVFEKDKNGLKLALLNPKNNEFAGFVSKKTGDEVKVYFATERDIQNSLILYHKELKLKFDELIQGQIETAKKAVQKDVPTSKIVDLLIYYAYQNKASDIHLEPEENNTAIRFRIDGVLHDVLYIPKDIHPLVISRIKVISRLRTDEHLSAQDGKLQVKLPEEALDVRVSIVPVVNGEKAVLRLLSSKSRMFSLSELGIEEENLELIRSGFSKPYGMVLATGPTGSGKTTTIYSILKIVNSRNVNIATIEDPVEYDIEGVNQIQVNPKTNLTFASGLKAILRQDPNIIFVGEIRDGETADIAINSAMTGHLVLSTLHTNDAVTSIPRLLEMNIEPFLLASTLNVVVAQRLVRKICESCKVSYTEKKTDTLKNFPKADVESIFGQKLQITLYKGKGCSICHNSGYLGRTGIFEILTIDDNIKTLIKDKADSGTIYKKALELGMKTMLYSGLQKAERGLTTLEEILRVVRS